jgi:hypothetical protein
MTLATNPGAMEQLRDGLSTLRPTTWASRTFPRAPRHGPTRSPTLPPTRYCGMWRPLLEHAIARAREQRAR